MQKVIAVSDDDNKLEIAFSDNSVRHDYATDLVHIWDRVSIRTDEGGRKEKVPLEDAYNLYRDELVKRFNVKPELFSRAAAMLTLEAAIRIYTELKKTSIDFTNSRLLGSR